MTLALTRASTVGPILDYVRRAGGSTSRLFRMVDLSPAILDRAQSLIPLRDQFRLIETAARMIGDDALPPRLSVAAGVGGLGSYGRHFMSFPDLGSAISLAYLDYGRLLQASTRMDLSIQGDTATWTYQITAPLTVGRQKNELLALGYMLDLLRCFAGPSWAPDRVEVPGTLPGRLTIERLFGCSIRSGALAAVVFPAKYLECPAPCPNHTDEDVPLDPVPSTGDVATVARHSIVLERLVGRSGIASVAARMGMTVRTLQRRLADERTTFSTVVRETERAEAEAWLLRDGLSVTEIADRLGYADTAHFSRAFHRWTGMAPSSWSRRERMLGGRSPAR